MPALSASRLPPSAAIAADRLQFLDDVWPARSSIRVEVATAAATPSASSL
jgi:hypothetical protein